MEVKVLGEYGLDEALYAMSLSYFDESKPPYEWWVGQKEKAQKRADKMAHQGGGHNDFLTMTAVYLEIKAPLYMWKQLDRYQIGFRKMSTSTMHTLKKTGVTVDRFESPPKFFDVIGFNDWLKDASIEEVANELPDGFLQRRVVKTNYMTLRNIIFQRYNHRLPIWKRFCDSLYSQMKMLEWLPDKGELDAKAHR